MSGPEVTVAHEQTHTNNMADSQQHTRTNPSEHGRPSPTLGVTWLLIVCRCTQSAHAHALYGLFKKALSWLYALRSINLAPLCDY